MSSKRIVLPERLADWIDANIADLGGVRNVRVISCSALPFQWLWNPRARYTGLTLWNRIYIRDSFFPLDIRDLTTVELLFHELVHVAQFRRNKLTCPIRYLWLSAKFGYWNNPMEIEARTRAETLIEQFRKEMPL